MIAATTSRPGVYRTESGLELEDPGRIQRWLADWLDLTWAELPPDGRLRGLFRATAQQLLAGGKRIRPRLVLASYQILTRGRMPDQAVRAVAISLEVIHAFMLVHDDLIDQSELRRGQPTLHRALVLEGHSPGRASHLALLMGDLLLALALRSVQRAGIEPEILARVHAIYSEMLVETGIGQALDVLADDQPLESLEERTILDCYIRKTARYTLSGPLALGAAMAEADPHVIFALDAFGERLGLAYQFHNDLSALDPEADGADLDSGKRTWLLWRTAQVLDRRARRRLERVLESPAGPLKRNLLRRWIEASGAAEEARERIVELQAEAVRTLMEAPLTAGQKQGYLILAAMLSRMMQAGPSVPTDHIHVHVPEPGALAREIA